MSILKLNTVLMKPYARWIRRSRYPELRFIEDQSEIDHIWSESRTMRSARLNTGLLYLGATMVLLGTVDVLLARLFEIEVWMLFMATLPVVWVAGVGWMHIWAIKIPFRQALRAHLRSRGLPICLGCGRDVNEPSEQRCPECGDFIP